MTDQEITALAREYAEEKCGNETEHRPMYLVQGDEVGKGTTNEPLLRNVKIIKEL